MKHIIHLRRRKLYREHYTRVHCQSLKHNHIQYFTGIYRFNSTLK